MKKVFVTGTAGFIGFHLTQLLLEKGFNVLGFDGLTDYYDVQLKKDRLSILEAYDQFDFIQCMLEDDLKLRKVIERFQPDVIVHLAAQAGVRHSIENPRSYLDANITGTFNVLEAAKLTNIRHLLIASTSSVYGANWEMPFREVDKADTPLSFYAATKKATEAFGHSYSNIFKIPITMFRFFTVYGPWGRPDMALFKFTKAIINEEPIDVYNHGLMTRDFTYVSDLVNAIYLLFSQVPTELGKKIESDSISPVAPFRIVNIGNSSQVKLVDFIRAIEQSVGKNAIMNLIEMQKGDVAATWADTQLLQELTQYAPNSNLQDGVSQFVDWYRSYYSIGD